MFWMFVFFGIYFVCNTYILNQYKVNTIEVFMQKETVFSMKLESDLRASFMAEAEAAHRPASQILRDLMREFIQRQKNAREYEEFLRQKVELARDQIHSGLVISNNEVEADFSARRSAKKKKL